MMKLWLKTIRKSKNLLGVVNSILFHDDFPAYTNPFDQLPPENSPRKLFHRIADLRLLTTREFNPNFFVP